MMIGDPLLAAIVVIAGTVFVWGVAAAIAGLFSRSRRGRPDQALSDQYAIVPAVVETVMSDVVIHLDPGQGIARVSASCLSVLRLDPRSLTAEGLDNNAETVASVSAVREFCQLGVGERVTKRFRRGDGELIWVDARRHVLGDDGRSLLLLRDVTRQMVAETLLAEARERLTRLANEDPLTGLANRACFLETTEGLIGGAERIALLFLDLDRFRPINDVHGHAVGDMILREVAHRLSRELTGEPLVARLGADEFAVLMRLSDGETGVAARARDMIRVISEPIEVGAMTLDVSATIGIAMGPNDGTRAVTLLRNAGIAMGHARQAGSACYRFFEARMSDELSTAEELKADLRSAIVAGEITPYFQPLVRLADNRVVGFEVLARWVHPGRGMLPPMVFLPLVEELGLSAAMFASVVTQACRAARDWPEDIRLSVNVSPAELQDESLPEDLRGIMREAGMAEHRLEIEVTENALIHDSRIARGVVDRLRALGMTMALDDFGTGFSSLYHLRELPFDKVKIDKSFMRALDSDADSARYVSAIIGLGHTLGLELTAEGIEDLASMRLLRDMGCTYGQGYLFGRPVPAAEAAAIAQAGSAVILAA
jgi:diguanylate cyclase (GGDEF)-like protein